MLVQQPHIIFEGQEELDSAALILGPYYEDTNGLQKVGIFACGITFIVARNFR